MSFGFSVGDFVEAIELANKIRKEFADAPGQFKAISDEVRSLSIVLQDADVALTDRELSYNQGKDMEDIDKGCRNVLNELHRILDKNSELGSGNGSVGKRIKRGWQRLNWKPEDIDELRSRISTNISLLNTFNGRLTRDNVVKLVQHQEDQEGRIVLNWISPIDYAPQQNDFITRQQEGTGQWLLDSDEFQAWLETDQQTLFCPGIPGAGKTILTSIVIKYLFNKYQKGSAKDGANIGIAYIYCNFRRRDEQRVENLLASLLKQLAQNRFPLPDSVKDLYKQHKATETRPSLGEIFKTLHSVVAAYSRVYIVVDALDECQESDKCRSIFLSNIFDLQATTRAKLFATSRPSLEIERKFKGYLTREILASDEDVQRYLDSHMSQLRPFVLSKPKLQEEIKTEITRAVEGMFLLAQLYLGSLEDKTTPKVIKTTLKQFQKQSQGSSKDKKLAVLCLAYEKAMERITGQKEGFQLLANKVLSWIICARRPLTTVELQHAIAVEIGELELDQDNLPELDDMVSVCAGLVTVDKESNVIRLVHYTTQEYFERTQKHWFPDAELEITTTCINYLLFDIFESGFCRTDIEFEERLQSNQFFEYAAQNWGYHCRCIASNLTLALNQMAITICESETKAKAASQGLLVNKHSLSYSGYSQNGMGMTGLHLVAYFGVEVVTRLLLNIGNIDINSRDSNGRTPLSWAAENGHEAVVKLLLATSKVDADSKDDKYSWTPLSWAARNGHEAVVKLLLATSKVDADFKDGQYGQTPLSWAAENGHEAVVKLLLATSKVDADSKDDIYGWTPLSWAARNGHEAVVKLLLATSKVDADSKDDEYGQTPLSWAAGNGHKTVVKLLLATSKVDADSDDEYGRTPLSWAAENGHEAVVKLLLATSKVDANPKDDEYGRTPLLWAAKNGHEAIVKLLLATSKIDANSEDDEYGKTLLS